MPPEPQGPSLIQSIVGFSPFLLILAFMLYMPWAAQKKERKKKEDVLNKLKKGTRVRTIGGIAGTVHEVLQDDVVLVVDQRNDTRLIFAKASIASAIEDSAAVAKT